MNLKGSALNTFSGVANGEDDVKIRRVADNILINRSQTSDKGWSSSLSGWMRDNSPSP